MPVERTSILKRPIRAPNPLSEESADKQYQAELAKLQAKRDRYQNTQTFLKQMLNPSKPEKREFQSAMNDMRMMQLEHKRQQELQQKIQDQSLNQTSPPLNGVTATAVSSVSLLSEKESDSTNILNNSSDERNNNNNNTRSSSPQSVSSPPGNIFDGSHSNNNDKHHHHHHHQPHSQLSTETHYHNLIQHRRLDAPRPGSARSRAMAKEMLEENKRLAAFRNMEKARSKVQEEEKAKKDALYWDNSSQYYR